jgi:hypothetical protein
MHAIEPIDSVIPNNDKDSKSGDEEEKEAKKNEKEEKEGEKESQGKLLVT